MSLQKTPKAPKGARYTLPDEGDLLKGDWSLTQVLQKISAALGSVDRPLQLLPSTQDVVNLLAEALDLAIQCLSEDHWAEAPVNPEIEVGETSAAVEDYHLLIDPTTGRPTVSEDPDLGVSSPKVAMKPGKDYGSVASRVKRNRRTWQLGKEPHGLFSLCRGVRTLLAGLPPVPWGPSFDEKLGSFGYKMLHSAESMGATKGGTQTASGAELTIAKMANQLRRLRRGSKVGNPGKQGKGQKNTKNR